MTAEAPPDEGPGLGAQSLVQLVVTRIRADILRGALAPGERLVEEQLTRRFGTSRAPLREALRLLGEQGLVEHLPRRGVRVVDLSPQDIEELFGLRDALERFAVGTALADGPPAPDRLAALERTIGRIETAVGADRADAHREFHLALVALAGHRHLLRVYEPVLLQLQLYMATNMRREAEVRSAAEGVRRHRALYDAVASGDVDAALEALSTHGARTYLVSELDETRR
ncbi:GntR family transcriptional regulator [Actinomycetospora chiangmaiensis]|uniref:GntR family transcriptional regulator n=1 Tax=Actinomycetospora chiangmaiensis TaxID=402650 RepID=UPI0003785E14|nr:GntR family transcriptional regulator [Actinomycetospora chiangmaiensis]